MKLRILFALLFWGLATANGKNLIQTFNRPDFYDAMASGKLGKINEQLMLLSSASVPEKDAYEGALLIRKAGLVKLPAEKLKLFKKGRIKLETALMNDADNGEYHFLRLAVQENAPKIVKYKANIETDKAYVKKTFKNLSPAVQHAIIEYSKNSKILRPQDF